MPHSDRTPAADDAPIRVLASDQQVRFEADGIHNYTLRRSRIQTSQGLSCASVVNAVWNPSRESVQVHAVRIIRGDQVIDALAGQTFEVLRRENNLEQSMLDGTLTATLQPRDLRVGDILETAFTIHDKGGVLAPHRETSDVWGRRDDDRPLPAARQLAGRSARARSGDGALGGHPDAPHRPRPRIRGRCDRSGARSLSQRRAIDIDIDAAEDFGVFLERHPQLQP